MRQSFLLNYRLTTIYTTLQSYVVGVKHSSLFTRLPSLLYFTPILHRGRCWDSVAAVAVCAGLVPQRFGFHDYGSTHHVLCRVNS